MLRMPFLPPYGRAVAAFAEERIWSNSIGRAAWGDCKVGWRPWKGRGAMRRALALARLREDRARGSKPRRDCQDRAGARRCRGRAGEIVRRSMPWRAAIGDSQSPVEERPWRRHRPHDRRRRGGLDHRPMPACLLTDKAPELAISLTHRDHRFRQSARKRNRE